ncbi:hypothetical protein NDU88_007268 [Pleurodeles waltl]|uniref:Uncharacterized protein n=1 Tax=Pleurodeles waltl TaxID=8319 RepID=A0AAV7QK77_PLEWA|nr:hypothetical protein NDU88_007268 [Pleurodeles waltl]
MGGLGLSVGLWVDSAVVVGTPLLAVGGFLDACLSFGSLFASPARASVGDFYANGAEQTAMLIMRAYVPFLQEEGGDNAPVAAEDTEDSDEDREEEDVDNRAHLIQQYFQ